jgi:hypothetical protein
MIGFPDGRQWKPGGGGLEEKSPAKPLQSGGILRFPGGLPIASLRA